MISMRYAWNFAHGQGLVWNAGQHIEGYSNLLMTLLMSAAALFLNKPLAVLAVQLFGVITLLAVGFVTKQLADEINAGRPHQRLDRDRSPRLRAFLLSAHLLDLDGHGDRPADIALDGRGSLRPPLAQGSPHSGPADGVLPGRACFPHPQ